MTLCIASVFIKDTFHLLYGEVEESFLMLATNIICRGRRKVHFDYPAIEVYLIRLIRILPDSGVQIVVFVRSSLHYSITQILNVIITMHNLYIFI